MKIFHSGVPNYHGSDGQSLLFARGEGGVVFDCCGKKYIDFVLGYGPVVLGHAREDFEKIISSHLRSGIHLPGYAIFHQEYLDRLLSEFPSDMGACFFKTSSEAVTAALRIAAHMTGKLGVLRCGFVGWHDVQICKTVRWHEPPQSDARKDMRFVSCMRGCDGKEGVFNWTSVEFEELDNILTNSCNTIGALVFDAYQAIWIDTDILIKSFELCRSKGIVVIFDETKTAGRIDTSIAYRESLPVDMIILGKSLANGAPLSLLVGSNEVMSYSTSARVSGTFSKELLSVYSAIATLDLMQKYNGYTKLKYIGHEIVRIFNEASSDANVINKVEAVTILGGGMFELRFVPEIETKHSYRKLLANLLVDNGILLLQGHPSFVCLSHESIDNNILYDKFFNSLSSWANANMEI